MENGLLFWVIILAVAVLQGIGQKKKKPGQQGQKPPGPPFPQPAPPEDQERVSVSPRPTRASPRSGQVAGESQSSEGMIPEDVWKEILGLARGEPRPAEAEAQPPVEPEPVPWEREAPRRGVKAAAGGAEAKTPSPQGVRPFPTSHGAGGGPAQNQARRLRIPLGGLPGLSLGVGARTVPNREGGAIRERVP